jgi:N6-adenosine-specific RNA methylase IME4
VQLGTKGIIYTFSQKSANLYEKFFVPTQAMQFHPLANIFPLLKTEELANLAADIQANGLREPIWTHNNQIIDGRNRYLACAKLGVTPEQRKWSGKGSLAAFVVSLNLHRRHLSESQRAMVAAKLTGFAHGGDRKSDQVANLQFDSLTQTAAADLLNVSPRSVAAAVKIKDEGAAALLAAVEAGQASVSAAAAVATLSAAEQREIVAKGETEILRAAREIRARKTTARRQQRIAKIVELAAQPVSQLQAQGRFPLIYADPPWRYDFCPDDADAIENRYPTMALADICALPVSDAALDDCVLLLWATSPKLEEGFQVIKAWGFTYRTCAVWDKDWLGQGYFFRQRHELLLVATRGNVPVPVPQNRPPSIFTERRTVHSRKPEIAYSLVEQMYPELPKLELFARQQRPGWTVWGNQVRANFNRS